MVEYTSRKILLYAFILITVATAFAILLANLGVFGESVRTSNFAAVWGTTTVLAEIVGTTGMAFKWEFFSPKSYLITFKFISENSSDSRGLDHHNLRLDECSYDIINPYEPAKPVSSGNLAVAVGLSGEWECSIPVVDFRPEYIIKVSVKDSTGDIWNSKPFHLAQRIEVERS